MTVYLDNDYCCHTEYAEGLTPYETDFFDGKCKAFIEGYRIVPAGIRWANKNGAVFQNDTDMIAPAVDSRVLEAYQKQYEDMLAEMSTAYQEGVNSI